MDTKPITKPRRWDNKEYWGREETSGEMVFFSKATGHSVRLYPTGHGWYWISLLGLGSDGKVFVKEVNDLCAADALALAKGWVSRGEYRR